VSEDYQLVESDEVFRGHVIALHKDTLRMGDQTTVREIVEHPGAVGVVAIDDDDNVVLVNQYRHPVRRRLDELPAGLLDVEGEPALTGAQRELVEEASLRASQWDVLVDLYTSPGFSNEAIRIYLARGLSPVDDRDGFVPEHEEVHMTVTRVPLADAVRRALAGEIQNAAAVAGILAAGLAHARGWTGLRPADAPWPAKPDRA